jgi:hypothetical protein
MKKHVLRLVLVGLFALSVGVAGAVFAEVASAGPLLPCPHCNTLDLSCVGSPCTCNWDGYGYICQLVK